MSHELESIEASLHSLPESVMIVAALVTRLGDPWFVLLVAGGLYLAADQELPSVIDRRDATVLLALVLGGLATVVGLKALVAHPRPPGATVPPDLEWVPAWLAPLLDRLTTADGYSLPSGHALLSTVFYGGLAHGLQTHGVRSRWIGAAVVVLAVSLTRLFLGVHYLLDVVAGVAAGGLLLAVVWYLAAGRPGRALLLSVGLGVGAVALAGFTRAALTILGGAIGARIAWGVVGADLIDRQSDRGSHQHLIWFGLPVLAGALALIHVGSAAVGRVTGGVLGFVGGGIVAATLIVLPLVGERRDER